MTDPSDVVTIVSGLPRSGTSMMMRMLEAGGMQVLADHIRVADEDNPRGYYEFERVKQIEHDSSWLEDAKGKAVKMISWLLKYLPPDYVYRVIFMQRNMQEILASQREMLVHRGEPTDAISEERMAALFSGHLKQIEAWMEEQPNVDVIYVSYNEVLKTPLAQAKRVNRFLDNVLSLEDMVKAVDQSLYRQRR